VIAAIVEKCEVGLVWKESEGVICRRKEEKERNTSIYRECESRN
jgi:hypothetical protein